MKEKRIEFVLYKKGYNWRQKEPEYIIPEGFLCVDTLSTLFNIPKGKRKIVAVFSNKRMPESYRLSSAGWCEIRVSGKGLYAAFQQLRDVVQHEFGGMCYGRIEYE